MHKIILKRAGALRKSGGVTWGRASHAVRRRLLVLRTEEAEALHMLLQYFLKEDERIAEMSLRWIRQYC